MSLFYRKYKNNKSKHKGYGKWYARAVHVDTVGIEEMAQVMQESCTVKRADVLAVLSELGPTVKNLLQDSHRVQIPYLGCFKACISTTGETDPDKFNVRDNVKGTHIVFQPEVKTTVVAGKRARIKVMLEGISMRDVDTLTPTTSGNAGNGGSGSSGSGANGGDTGTGGDTGNTGTGDNTGGDNTGSGSEGGADVRP